MRPNKRRCLFELALAADERRLLDGQVRPIQRLQWWELLRTQLVQAQRRTQILQPVLAQITQRHGRVEKRLGRLRDEDLSAVAGAHDAGSAVDVHADVALVAHNRLAGVHTHPNADRSLGEALLSRTGRGDSVGRPGEGNEERVTLRVHLDTAMARTCVAQPSTVLREHFRVTISELVQQAGRTLDVREEQRDRPARQLPHIRMIPQRESPAKPKLLFRLLLRAPLPPANPGWSAR